MSHFLHTSFIQVVWFRSGSSVCRSEADTLNLFLMNDEDDDMTCPWDYGDYDAINESIVDEEEEEGEDDYYSSWSEENLPKNCPIAETLQRPGKALLK